MSFFEWLGRVIMLVLAGMITLSIIGAIAAIPSGSVPDAIRIAQREPPLPPPVEAQPQPPPKETESPTEPQTTAGAQVTNQLTIAPREPEPVDPAEWLEAITYALLALAGIAALATMILWRMLHQGRRIADALEALSRPAPPCNSSPPSRA